MQEIAATRMQKTMELMVYRDIHPEPFREDTDRTVVVEDVGGSPEEIYIELESPPPTSSHANILQSSPKSKSARPNLSVRSLKSSVKSSVSGLPFRNFDDYVNFPKELKHSMCIHPSEFVYLYEKYSESDSAYETVQERPTLKLQKYLSFVETEGGFLTLVRAYCVLENLTMEAIMYNILDIGQRNRWDKNFFGFRLVEAPPGGCEIMTSTFRSPVPFIAQHRDFVQYRRVSMQRDDQGDPIYLILFRSAEHPDVPEKKTAVRGETYMSGYILQKKKTDRNKLDFFLVSLADPRGLIPKWIVNKGATTAPPQWVRN